MYKRKNCPIKDSKRKVQKKKKCATCAETFNNRYDSIIHEAMHTRLVISLPKLDIQKCKLCPRMYTSVKDLNTHLYKDHGSDPGLACRVVLSRLANETAVIAKTREEVKVKNSTKQQNQQKESAEIQNSIVRDGGNSERSKPNGDVEYFNDEFCGEVKKELDDQVSEIEIYDKLKPDPDKIDDIIEGSQLELQAKPESPDPSIKYEDEDVNNPSFNNNQQDPFPKKSFGSKIIFEDDVIVSLNPSSLASLAVVNDNDHHHGDDGDDDDDENKNWFGDDHDNGEYQASIKFEDDNGNCSSSSEANPFSDSIGYDTLVLPGEFVCSRCGKIFQNRLSLIKHETSHMRWKRPYPAFCPYCDRYIANGRRNLCTHVRRAHADEDLTSRRDTKNCSLCGLKYVDYSRHVSNYHTSLIDIDKSIVDENETAAITKTMEVCELCYSFFKMRQNCKYVVIGDIEFEGRRPCGRCGREYFELKSVKRVTAKRSRGWKHRKGSMSNEQRLKIIHRRLKKMR